MSEVRFLGLAVLAAALGALLVVCPGCPTPPPPPPITIVDADGASAVVSVDSACANLAKVCGASVLACTSGLNSLQGEAPEDLLCMTTAATPGAARGCRGVGTLCPQ